jgi:hypothetical protein
LGRTCRLRQHSSGISTPASFLIQCLLSLSRGHTRHRRPRRVLARLGVGVLAGLAFVADAHAELADVSTAGALADAAGSPVGLSANGRYVFFSSSATNLVAGSPAGTHGYLRDRTEQTTTLPIAGYLPVAMSTDARFLLVSSGGLWVFDRDGAPLDRVDVSSAEIPGNAPASATEGAISSDGRFVVFWSAATNLVAGDLNGASDVFLRDRTAGTTSLVSAATDGDPGGGTSNAAVISADGSTGAFGSDAADLVPGDENADADVFARPLQLPATQLVSVSSAGLQDVSAPPTQCVQAALSREGRFVAFSCGAPNLAPPMLANTQRADHAYVRDRLAGTTARADVDAGGVVLSAAGPLVTPTIAGDGRRAVYWANAVFPGRLVQWDATPSGRASVLDVRGQRPLLSQDGLTLVYQDIPTEVSTAHVGVLPLAPPATDTQPPTVSCGAPDAAWHAANVTIGCTASDTGSGLADGSTASFGLATDVPAGSESAGSTTGSRAVCDLAGLCTTAGPIGPIRVDRRAATVACEPAPPPSTSSTQNVVVRCSASDGGAGLVDAADAAIVLRTTVPGGASDPTAMTSARTVCDQVGNCGSTGPLGPYRIDRTAAPPEERDTDDDGINDAADVCPVTAGVCTADEDVGLPARVERVATTTTAGRTALTTCATKDDPPALASIAAAAGRRVGAAARRALNALASNACAASLSTAAASVAASPAARAVARAAATPASATQAFIPTVHNVAAAIKRYAKSCGGKSCRRIVNDAADAAQSTAQAGSDAIALTVARSRLAVARTARDRQGRILQTALIRVYEGALANSQDTRAADYRTVGKVLRGSDISTTVSRPALEDARGGLSKGIGIPGQTQQDLAGAGIADSRVNAAIVQTRLQQGPTTVSRLMGSTPRSRTRKKLAAGLAYDSVGRVIIALAAQGVVNFETAGRLLNTLESGRKACSPAEQQRALTALAAQAKGTRAAALVATSARLLTTNSSLAPRCA